MTTEYAERKGYDYTLNFYQNQEYKIFFLNKKNPTRRIIIKIRLVKLEDDLYFLDPSTETYPHYEDER